jgi:tetratricopeptide (TPR) repeat protein
MRLRSVLAPLVAASMALVAVVAIADPPKGKEIRRDPDNKKGISPYMELVVKGEAAFVARDLPGAISTFQEAIKMKPDEMLGFYRLGEAELESGKMDDADKTWEAALSKHCTQGQQCERGKGGEDLKAKVLFNIAFLRERQQKWDAAKDAWQAYAAFLQGNSKIHGYPATAADRIKMIDRRVQLEADYGKVKQRIAARIAEKEKEAAENAKKDKLNK